MGFQFDILRFLPESMDDIDFSLSDSEMSDACAKLEVKRLLLASRWTSLYFPGQGLDNFEPPFPFQNFQENTWIIEKPSFTDPGIPLQNK